MKRYKFSLSIGFANVRQEEFTSHELNICEENMSPEELTEALEEEWILWSQKYIEGGIEDIEEDDE